MKNALLIFTLALSLSCSNDDSGDTQETVELTIYPETSFSSGIFSSNSFYEYLQFTQNAGEPKSILSSTGESFNNFDYQKGYSYLIKAKKTTLKNPPQDGSSVLYDYIETLSKERVITQDSTAEILITVSPNKVKYTFRNGETGDAFLIREEGSPNLRVVTKIENFDFKEGTTYKVAVVKTIQAEPYKVTYESLEIVSEE